MGSAAAKVGGTISFSGKQAYVSPELCKPIGPYNHAVSYGNPTWLSGQIGVNQDGELVEGGVAAQAEQAMKNLGSVLSASGCTYDGLVKVTIFLTKMSDFAAVNEVYTKYFSSPAAYPARSCVAVAELPKGALVEIEGFALRA